MVLVVIFFFFSFSFLVGLGCGWIDIVLQYLLVGFPSLLNVRQAALFYCLLNIFKAMYELSCTLFKIKSYCKVYVGMFPIHLEGKTSSLKDIST